jgi:copper chaperone
MNSNTMKNLKFKTSINCMGCVSKVTPFLDAQEGIEKWGVDVNSPDKILTVESNGVTVEKIKSKLEKIGFKVESVNSK